MSWNRRCLTFPLEELVGAPTTGGPLFENAVQFTEVGKSVVPTGVEDDERIPVLVEYVDAVRIVLTGCTPMIERVEFHDQTLWAGEPLLYLGERIHLVTLDAAALLNLRFLCSGANENTFGWLSCRLLSLCSGAWWGSAVSGLGPTGEALDSGT